MLLLFVCLLCLLSSSIRLSSLRLRCWLYLLFVFVSSPMTPLPCDAATAQPPHRPATWFLRVLRKKEYPWMRYVFTTLPDLMSFSIFLPPMPVSLARDPFQNGRRSRYLVKRYSHWFFGVFRCAKVEIRTNSAVPKWNGRVLNPWLGGGGGEEDPWKRILFMKNKLLPRYTKSIIKMNCKLTVGGGMKCSTPILARPLVAVLDWWKLFWICNFLLRVG